ncbi:ATP-binding cassette sub- C member 8 [Dinochytrium kinnereticum]|nr:ATP-binding cassette sub- C member 8 [Dinochytrium kinnereticum]
MIESISFAWLNPIFELGNKRFLKLDDLPTIPEDYQDARLFSEFSKVLSRKRVESKNPHRALIQALVSEYGWSSVHCAFFKLAADSCALLVPFVLRDFVAWSNDGSCHENGSCRDHIVKGSILILALLALQLGQTVAGNMHLQRALKVAFQLQQLRKLDCNKIATSLGSMHTIYSAPLVITASITLLYTWLGSAALYGFSCIFLFVYVQSFLMKRLGDFYHKLSAAANSRVKEIREVLAGFKAVKLACLEDVALKKIVRLRQKETFLTKVYLISKSSLAGLTQIIPFFALTCTLAAYYSFEKSRSPEIAFILSSVTVFQSLRVPMILFPQVLSQALEAFSSLKKISEFIESEDHKTFTDTTKLDDSLAVLIPKTTLKWPAVETRPIPLTKEKLASDSLTVLNHISIKKGSLVAVIGPIASGKSSFLAAISGDLKPSEDRDKVCLKGTVAIASSPAWLFNGSIAENVVLGEEIRGDVSLEKALKWAGMEKDLEAFAEGDRTIVGENGLMLSGGQRNRVGLARAFFRDSDILLMDDPFLGIDTSVANTIFHDTIKKELSGKTRIIATNHPQFLPLFDRIIVLDNLSIVEDGTYDNLKKNVSSFLHRLAYDTKDDQKQSEPSLKSAAKEPPPGGRDGGKRPGGPPKKGGRSMFVVYAQMAGGILPLVLISGIVLGTQVLRVQTDAWMLSFIRSNSGRGDGVIFLFFMGFIQVFSILVQGAVIAQFALKASNAFHLRALEELMKAPYSAILRNPIGAITSKFSKDLMDLDTLLPETIRILFFTLSLVLTNLFSAAFANFTFLAVLLPTLAYFYSLQKYYRKTSKQMKRLENMERSNLNALILECLTGSDAIRQSSSYRFFDSKFTTLLNRYNRPIYLFFHMQRWLSLRLEVAAAFLSASTAFLCLVDVARRGAIGEPTWGGMTLVYCLSISASLTWCVRQVSESERLMLSAERIFDFAGSLGREVEGRGVLGDSLGHEVEFRSLSVVYGDGREGVADVSLGVMAGERFGIVGRTGSGKTTVVSSLLRLFDASAGSILINGQDVREVTLRELRSAIAMVPQDPVLFSGTVRFNLDPFDEVEDNAIWDVLKSLGISDRVKSLKNDLYSDTTDLVWTSGEKQLLCISRAILRHPKTLVLDEATSLLDAVSESAVLRVLSSPPFRNVTLIAVSHRVEFLQSLCSRVAVIQDGRVVEVGGADEMLRVKRC